MLARELFAIKGKDYTQLQVELEEDRDQADGLAPRQRRQPAVGTKYPGIGPIGASALVMKTPDPRAFRSGRHFAAWIGLTPKDHSTGGKTRLGEITRAGDEILRSVLVVGAPR